jgi:hypothetical protein
MNIKEEYTKSLKMREVEEALDLILYRPLALVFVRLVYKTRLTPNGVTYLSLLSGLASAYSFAQGTASSMAWGGIWYAVANILDCSDGQLARLQGSGTPLGRLVDGVVDWIVSVAIFVGLALGMQRVTGDPAVWFLVSAAGITSAVHSFFFDLYQQQFISLVRGQESFVDRELSKIREQLPQAKGLRRAMLQVYVRYLQAQQNSRPTHTGSVKYPPDQYRNANRNVMRFWTLLGPTTNRSLLMLAGLMNNPSIFLWPVITVGNALLVIAIVWQRAILRRLDDALRRRVALPDNEPAPV